MTQPDYVPVELKIRPFWRQGVPVSRTAPRVSELKGRRLPAGRMLGSPGPDQGYALKLAESLRDRLVLDPEENVDDVLAVAVAIATKRASVFGRAPMVWDIIFALDLFSFLGAADRPLVEFRKGLIAGTAHNYQARRVIADMLPLEILRQTPEVIREQKSLWSEWYDLPPEGASSSFTSDS